VTVLVGANGSGKSTVLEAMAVAPASTPKALISALARAGKR
jgi:predicted ATPase